MDKLLTQDIGEKTMGAINEFHGHIDSISTSKDGVRHFIIKPESHAGTSLQACGEIRHIRGRG